MNDRYGLFTTQSLYAQYAYRQKLGKGYLSVGVDLGFVNVGFKGDSVNLSKMGDDYHEFTKEYKATCEGDIEDKIYANFGSKHGINRNQISIQSIEEIATEDVLDPVVKEIM